MVGPLLFPGGNLDPLAQGKVRSKRVILEGVWDCTSREAFVQGLSPAERLILQTSVCGGSHQGWDLGRSEPKH